MFYRILILIILFSLANCTTNTVNNDKFFLKKSFVNKGFALIYNDELYKKKIIKSKLDKRSLSIIQKNIKKGTTVRVKNIYNDKFVIAKVVSNSLYPNFNNSVISERIAEEIELNLDHPYVEIYEILNNSSSIIKKVKTYDEEKNVARKAPIESISINDLNKPLNILKDTKQSQTDFTYIIIIADFYFKETAMNMVEVIKKETIINNPLINNLTNTKYRVFLGPFFDISSLQNAFNDISKLGFEDLEIIKNEKK